MSADSSYIELPTKAGEIDWDRVALNYHQYILSPYAAEMVTSNAERPARNLLLNYLHTIPGNMLSKMRVLDFGCGPGNLIPFINVKPEYFAAVDKSTGSLQIAASVAQMHAIDINLICDDIVNVEDDRGFDLIISSNSVLPNSREEVVKILSKLRSLLTENGRLLAIMPSFDTTLYLQELRREASKSGNETALLMNEEILAYADDGSHLQCYHTPESILEETKLAELKLIGELQKIYYPWDLCQRFGYGYYPQAREEIWDWFMIAGK